MNLNILQHLKSRRNIGTTLCLIGALSLNALPTAFAASRLEAGHENTIALIKGRVTDSKGQPLPGAIVKVKGTQKATAVDASGQFSIDAKPGDVLVITFVGFLPKEITVSDATSSLSIQLQDDNRAMQEVVVVGYGAVKKSDLTGSLSSIKSDDLNLGGTTANVGQAIQGKAAGVQVQQSNFAPGGGINITIRGGNSINLSNAPLYVVDGFISDNGNQINPNDIEDIEVLKDASAAAIYGSRGGNGVVLITTKKGKLGKATIDADVSNGRQYLTYKPSLLTGPQYAAIQNATFKEDGKSIPFPPGAQIANTNWLQEATQNADVNNRSLSISGANENSKIYVSGNYLNQLGVLKNTSLQKYSARIGAEKKMGDDITINTNFYGASSNSSLQTYTGDITAPLYGLLTALPTAPVYNADGSYHFYIPPGNSGLQNALANLLEPTNNADNKLFNGNVTIDYQIIRNLTYHLNAGAEYSDLYTGKYIPSTIPAGAASHGIASLQDQSAFRWLVENYLTYKFKINEQHDFTLLLGTSSQRDISTSLSASSKNFSTDAFLYNRLDAGSISNNYSSNKYRNELIDYFGRVNYAYKDKLLATFTLRRDGSSQFGYKNRYGFFPSGALAYRLGDEEFIKNLNTFSSLKARIGYGVTGNDRLPITNNNNYQYLTVFTNWNTVLSPDGTLQPGIEAATLANPSLKWESTAQLDLGLDMGFLNDRITATLDVYRKKTSDLLMQIPVGQYYGFSYIWGNGGSVENKGIELSINTANVRTTNFSWNTSFNIAYNKQKDLSLAPGVAELDASTANPSGTVSGQQFTKLVPGQELGELYGYVYEGVIKTGENYAPQPSSKPGDPKYADLNGDGKITPADRTYLGNTSPHYILGFGNDFRYKGFDLNVFFQGAFGYHLFDMNRLVLESTTSTDALNRFVPGVNENTSIPREGYFTGIYSGDYVNSRFVENASYLRLKSLSLSYDLPKSLFTRVKHIQGLRIYGTAQNLLTITSYKGTDPEVNVHTSTASATNYGGGLDFGSFPAFRTVAFGIRLSLQ